MAAAMGHNECVRLLIEGGANKEAVKHNAYVRIFMFRPTHRVFAFVKINRFSDRNTKHRVCISSRRCLFLSCATRLLFFYDIFSCLTQIRHSALLGAAAAGNSECVRLLVEAGANKNVKDHVRYMYALLGFHLFIFNEFLFRNVCRTISGRG